MPAPELVQPSLTDPAETRAAAAANAESMLDRAREILAGLASPPNPDLIHAALLALSSAELFARIADGTLPAPVARIPESRLVV